MPDLPLHPALSVSSILLNQISLVCASNYCLLQELLPRLLTEHETRHLMQHVYQLMRKMSPHSKQVVRFTYVPAARLNNNN
jgi:hypothetical protein